jgi:hypothetical protein
MAPRLDLCNRELLASHLNALVASQIGMPGLDDMGAGKPSIMRLVIDDNDKMPLSKEVRSGLDMSPATFGDIKATFKRAIRDFEGELETNGATWYSDQWIDQNLSKVADNLDRSLDRWRRLYRSARTILSRATQKIESGTLSLGSDEYRKHKRNQDQATRQLDLLRNDLAGRSSELSEFYPYRYLASEGFLPGYNFTRLPLRVFLPTGDSSGEFVSRPRSIALREFGPLNIIYHNGRKYRVCQLVIQDAESALTEAKVSSKTGYFMAGDAAKDSTCPFSGIDLSDNAFKEHLHDLMEMAESRAEEIDRISCEEEERVSRGYEIRTYFSVDGGQVDRVRKAVATSTENALLEPALCSCSASDSRQHPMAQAENRRLPHRPDFRRLARLHAGHQCRSECQPQGGIPPRQTLDIQSRGCPVYRADPAARPETRRRHHPAACAQARHRTCLPGRTERNRRGRHRRSGGAQHPAV